MALKTLEIYERDDIIGHVRAVSPAFTSRLAALGDHPLVGQARGIGLIGGLELVADKGQRRSFPASLGLAAKCAALALDEGLMIRALGGDVLALCPPLVINEDEIGQMFDAVERTLERAEAWVAKDGLRNA